jgi:hypothetical protein
MLVFVELAKQVYFEIGFQRPSNPTLVIQKFTTMIEDNTKMVHKSPHQKEAIYTSVGCDLRLVGLSLIVMVLGRDLVLLQGVEASSGL